MIKIKDKPIRLEHFPDGTLLMKEVVEESRKVVLTWRYENNEELVALYFLVGHLRAKGISEIELKLPYLPNARQDRVKEKEDVFTLKYFAQMINSLQFTRVTVLDPHSYVGEALIDRIHVQTPEVYVNKVLEKIAEEETAGGQTIGQTKTGEGQSNCLLFYPDEGAMKRYSSLFRLPHVFGLKRRNWITGQIQGLDLAGQTECIPGRRVLIIDDICSRGGTFYHSAKALKAAGAEKIYLYISHCENTILEGELLTTDWIERVYTTNSIFTKSHEKVEVFSYE